MFDMGPVLHTSSYTGAASEASTHVHHQTLQSSCDSTRAVLVTDVNMLNRTLHSITMTRTAPATSVAASVIFINI